MKRYYVKTFGNEDNGFKCEVCSYDYVQYIEVVQMLKENNTPFKFWVED